MAERKRKRKCTGCKDHFPSEGMVKLPAGRFHTVDCAIRYAQEQQMKKATADTKRAEKADRAQHRAAKECLKTVGTYIKEAQASVNRYIRLRDHNMPCISCGHAPSQKFGGTMDSGHYRSRGAAGHLRFNTFNIHGQCVKCNRYNSGNAVDYRLGLIERIGVDRVERLENDNVPRRFTIEYCKRLKKIFNKKARFTKGRQMDKVAKL
jgi:hypothetical protein